MNKMIKGGVKFNGRYDNSIPIKYKGKTYFAIGLAKIEECEVGCASLRANLAILREKVLNGTANFCDEEVYKCMKFKIRKSKTKEKIYEDQKIRDKIEKENIEKEKEIWITLNKLWKFTKD